MLHEVVTPTAILPELPERRMASSGLDRRQAWPKAFSELEGALAPGLSLVEDPNNGESFGMNRCRIFAEGIWNAFAKGLTDRDSRLHEVKQRFARARI